MLLQHNNVFAALPLVDFYFLFLTYDQIDCKKKA